ncbi:MAG: hypothetical protein HYY28_09570 [Betaproteobacteria bacterium]|nr:hypothetical protein [Betaproteobacteria bacterium]
MKIKIVNGRDFWAGVMFTGIGLAFMIASREYQMGSAVRMGPAYFPTVLGGMLAVLGLAVFIRGFVSKIPHTMRVFTLRVPVLIASIVVSVIAFYGADFIKGLGGAGTVIQYLLNAAGLLLFIGAWGPRALFIILVSAVIFGYLLKPLGLVAATAVLVFGSAWGGHEFKFKEVAIMYAALAIFGVFIFIYGLGLPMNIWPELG